LFSAVHSAIRHWSEATHDHNHKTSKPSLTCHLHVLCSSPSVLFAHALAPEAFSQSHHTKVLQYPLVQVLLIA
jgi:hypothetical protein